MEEIGKTISNLGADEILAQFCAHLEGERRLSAKTVEAYQRDISSFLGFIARHTDRPVDLRNLANLDIRDFRSYLAARRRGAKGISASSLARNLSALRTFYRYIERTWDVQNNAIGLIQGPKPKKPLPKPVSVQSSKDLIDLAGQTDDRPWIAARDSAIILLLYGAGLRISEALSLTQADLPLGDSLEISGKGNKTRIVPILPIIREAVAQYIRLVPFVLETQDFIFRGVRGGPLGARSVQKTITILRGSLGLPQSLTPHALRHSFATHLLSGGGDLRTIQELLGHASLTSTQIYTQVDSASLLRTHAKAHPRA